MKSELLIENKNIVVPGDTIATGMEFLPGEGTYRLDDKVIANRLGLLRVDGKVLKTIQLSGRYLPKYGDVIIAQVSDVLMTGWRLQTNSPYSAVMGMKDASSAFIKKGENLTRYFALEEYVVCKITQVTSQKLVDVTCRGPGLRKLKGGRVIKINSKKVPRIIGKNGSMVSMIKSYTGCQITVGQNGLIWVNGEPDKEIITIETIKKIENESHKSGLTENIEKFLKSHKLTPKEEVRRGFNDFNEENQNDS